MYVLNCNLVFFIWRIFLQVDTINFNVQAVWNENNAAFSTWKSTSSCCAYKNYFFFPISRFHLLSFLMHSDFPSLILLAKWCYYLTKFWTVFFVQICVYSVVHIELKDSQHENIWPWMGTKVWSRFRSAWIISFVQRIKEICRPNST